MTNKHHGAKKFEPTRQFNQLHTLIWSILFMPTGFWALIARFAAEAEFGKCLTREGVITPS